MRPELTILTDPVPYGRHFFVEPAKQMARRIRNFISPRPPYVRSKYRGHFAVTRTIVQGLQKIGVHSNYNPQKLAEVGEVVVVPGRLHNLYGRQLASASFAARFGVSIESAMTCGLTSHQVQWLDSIGVSGYLGNGVWIDE